MRLLWLLLAIALPGCLSLSSSWNGPEDFYAYVHEIAPEGGELEGPRGRTVTVCHAYACQMRTDVTFTEADLAPVYAVLAAADGPAAEREALRLAIAHLETVVGRRVGTSGDVGYLYLEGSGDPGQQDCIDETANTTSYLLMLEREGLMRHHRVRKAEQRGFIVDGRYPHFSASLREIATGTAWVIDSWPQANGESPRMLQLDDWYAERSA